MSRETLSKLVRFVFPVAGGLGIIGVFVGGRPAWEVLPWLVLIALGVRAHQVQSRQHAAAPEAPNPIYAGANKAAVRVACHAHLPVFFGAGALLFLGVDGLAVPMAALMLLSVMWPLALAFGLSSRFDDSTLKGQLLADCTDGVMSFLVPLAFAPLLWSAMLIRRIDAADAAGQARSST